MIEGAALEQKHFAGIHYWNVYDRLEEEDLIERERERVSASKVNIIREMYLSTNKNTPCRLVSSRININKAYHSTKSKLKHYIRQDTPKSEQIADRSLQGAYWIISYNTLRVVPVVEAAAAAVEKKKEEYSCNIVRMEGVRFAIFCTQSNLRCNFDGVGDSPLIIYALAPSFC